MFVSALLVLALGVGVGVDDFQFDSQTNADRYSKLIEEFRCPKCLNTNLAGSDAPIAQDLRRAVYRLINEGKTDQEIRTYMRERYGDFILYNPRLTPKTVMLWFTPLLLVLVGAWLILRLKDRRSTVTLTTEEAERLRNLTS
ncbi:MAG: cytochrome c-type biogenesis protein CcmH [Gammaproteobacteria bacterium]|nr:cytochrome c-type biogenesis protein CcmH [Gammaproteobacteria bacterium]